MTPTVSDPSARAGPTMAGVLGGHRLLPFDLILAMVLLYRLGSVLLLEPDKMLALSELDALFMLWAASLLPRTWT